MLDSLYVKNLALIDEEEVTFTEGLNVLSGETGAGKSILIGSVLIALGAKVHKEMIRANEKEAYIELIFSPTHPAVLEKLREYDIEPEDGQLIISKKITASKSVSKINKMRHIQPRKYARLRHFFLMCMVSMIIRHLFISISSLRS